MAQPKRRWSKQRTHTKRSTWKLDKKNLVECPHCHKLTEQHKACAYCGYYNGNEVIPQKDEKDEK